MIGGMRWTVVAAMLVLLVMGGCGPRRLDEVVFHDRDGLTLKLVRYYESLFLHYDGEIYVVMCRDAATAGQPRMDTQDAGWRVLGRGGAIGTESAADLLPAIREAYTITPDNRLIIRGTVLRISHAGCGPFATWDPTRQAGLTIDAVPKPDYCAPVGTGDCRYHDFFGERQPVYEDVDLDGERIAFTVSSPALVPSSLDVTSDDGGRSWHWQPAGVAGPR